MGFGGFFLFFGDLVKRKKEGFVSEPFLFFFPFFFCVRFWERMKKKAVNDGKKKTLRGSVRSLCNG